jgi:hypothetical protein
MQQNACVEGNRGMSSIRQFLAILNRRHNLSIPNWHKPFTPKLLLIHRLGFALGQIAIIYWVAMLFEQVEYRRYSPDDRCYFIARRQYF